MITVTRLSQVSFNWTCQVNCSSCIFTVHHNRSFSIWFGISVLSDVLLSFIYFRPKISHITAHKICQFRTDFLLNLKGAYKYALFLHPKLYAGHLFNAVADRWFPHNPLFPTAGNMTVGGIATHGLTEHFLKFKPQHLTFHSKNHYRWGQTVAYIGLHLWIIERVWTLGWGPSGKKPSSEIFSSGKLFGMIHGPFREKNKTLEDVVLESPENHTIWLFSVLARNKRLDTWWVYVIGHYSRTSVKNLVLWFPAEQNYSSRADMFI